MAYIDDLTVLLASSAADTDIMYVGLPGTGAPDRQATLLEVAKMLLSRSGDGSVSAPALAFDADPNTGLYRVGTDQIGFTTAGVERMRIAATAIRAFEPIWVEDGLTFDTGTNVMRDYEEGTFTPTITGITLGAGSASGYYLRIGDLVMVQVLITLGSGGAGTADLRVENLPWAADFSWDVIQSGNARAEDVSTGTRYFGQTVLGANSTVGYIRWQNAAGTYITQAQNAAGVPFTWTNGDSLFAGFIYKTDE